MAYQPNDPYRPDVTEEELRRQGRLNAIDNELQPDPVLAEGPANGAKVAMFAIAIAVVLGALFYGLNTTNINQAGTTPSTTTAQSTNPAAPPAMRDVTPRVNTEPGTTTGAATKNPPAPAPAANPPAKQNN